MEIIQLVFVGSLILCIGVSFVGFIGIGEGNEKESLLDFSYDELEGIISADGRDGRFVTDWFASNWVAKELKKEAQIARGCIIRTTSHGKI